MAGEQRLSTNSQSDDEIEVRSRSPSALGLIKREGIAKQLRTWL